MLTLNLAHGIPTLHIRKFKQRTELDILLPDFSEILDFENKAFTFLCIFFKLSIYKILKQKPENLEI